MAANTPTDFLGGNTLQITTRFNADMIEQQVEFGDGVNITEHLSNNVIRLREEGVKQALIALGWTPPEGFANKMRRIGWMTAESLVRLVRSGGNDSRGSTPVHAQRSVVAKFPVFVSKDDFDGAA